MQYLWGCFQSSRITLVMNFLGFRAHCSETLLVMSYLRGAWQVSSCTWQSRKHWSLSAVGCSIKHSLEMLRKQTKKKSAEFLLCFSSERQIKNNHLDNEKKNPNI